MLSSVSLKRLSVAVIFICALTFGLRQIHISGGGYANYPSRVVTATEPRVSVSIPSGATGTQIGQALLAAGVVESVESFFRAAVGNTKANTIAPGTHSLSVRISGAMAVEQLLDPKRIVALIKVFEGAWNSEVFAAMNATNSYSGDVSKSAKLVKLPAGITSLEGVLFPAQYSFADGTSAQSSLQNMVDKFNQEAARIGLIDPTGKLNKQELVTLASLIQAEGDTKDFAKISRVIRNRLVISMPLQLDSTIHYIKKSRGQIFLSTDSTKLRSPFNTYQHYGLPPAPIGNPGAAALAAAVAPADGDWLFFITVAPGDTRFTKSFTEFNDWKLLYEKNRKAGAFK